MLSNPYGVSMSHELTWHEIDKKKIAITRRAKYEWASWKATRRKSRYRGPNVVYRPATLGEFTIGEIQFILNQVRRFPLRKEHSIIFGNDNTRRYKVHVYNPDDTDETQTPDQETSR